MSKTHPHHEHQQATASHTKAVRMTASPMPGVPRGRSTHTMEVSVWLPHTIMRCTCLHDPCLDHHSAFILVIVVELLLEKVNGCYGMWMLFVDSCTHACMEAVGFDVVLRWKPMSCWLCVKLLSRWRWHWRWRWVRRLLGHHDTLTVSLAEERYQ